MVSKLPLLQNVRIAAPCPASWEEMDVVDGDRVRHCQGCNMNVYNLSAMTQPEAEGLLRGHEGRLCARYYQRSDGTILTKNCPVGMDILQMKLAQRSKAAAVLLLVAAAAAFAAAPTIQNETVLKPAFIKPVVPTMGAVAVVPEKPLSKPVPEHSTKQVLLGKIAAPKAELGMVVNWSHHAKAEKPQAYDYSRNDGFQVVWKKEAPGALNRD